MAQPRHAQTYNVRLDRTEARVIHAPTAHHARREIIHYDVADLCQPPRDLDAAGRAHVDGDRSFVAMEVALQSGLTRPERSRFALELDDFRALVGEDARQHRP